MHNYIVHSSLPWNWHQTTDLCVKWVMYSCLYTTTLMITANNTGCMNYTDINWKLQLNIFLAPAQHHSITASIITSITCVLVQIMHIIKTAYILLMPTWSWQLMYMHQRLLGFSNHRNDYFLNITQVIYAMMYVYSCLHNHVQSLPASLRDFWTGLYRFYQS